MIGDSVDKMCNAALSAVNDTPAHSIVPKPADLTKIFNKRIQRAVKERMITVELVKDLRDNRMTVSAFQFDKFTIVELAFMNSHYHGPTSCNPADEPNAMAGVGRAYARALNELFAKRRFGDLKKVRVIDESGNVCLTTPEMLDAMVRGTD